MIQPLKDEEVDVFDQEVFPEVFLLCEAEDRQLLAATSNTVDTQPAHAHMVAMAQLKEDWLVSRVDFLRLGWQRSLKVVSRACEYLERLRHAVHVRNKTNREGCCMCTTDPSISLARLAL
jgi:hypothetical protein